MIERTFTHADLEQMAAVAVRSLPEPQRKALVPAARAWLAAVADGRPATIEELAAACGRNAEELGAALRALPGGEWDADGRVVGFGMTLNPTPHRVETGGHRLYGWCVGDALGMLPAIGRTVQISSDCPVTGQTVTLTAGPDGVRDVRPPEAVVSALISGNPDAGVRGSVGDLGHFFASPDAASGWAREHPDDVLLSVPDAFHYARSVMRLWLGRL